MEETNMQKRNIYMKVRLFVSKMRRIVPGMVALDQKGSFTVEAAVIIPITMFLMMSLIMLSFSLFNRCSMERAVISGALQGSEQVFESNQKKQEVANRAIRYVLKHNLLNGPVVNKYVRIKGEDVIVRLEIQESESQFSTFSQKHVVNPVRFVRICRKAEGLIKNDASGI